MKNILSVIRLCFLFRQTSRAPAAVAAAGKGFSRFFILQHLSYGECSRARH